MPQPSLTPSLGRDLHGLPVHAQRPEPVRPPSRWLIGGHSTGALGASVGDVFGSINTSTGVGGGVEVGFLVTPRLVAYAGLDIAKQPINEVGFGCGQDPVAPLRPDSAWASARSMRRSGISHIRAPAT